MEKAEALIEGFVLAGYSKIHIDTSMRLGDDDKTLPPLPVVTVAERSRPPRPRRGKGVSGVARAESGCGAAGPTVIGSEVPTPGGAQDGEEQVSVTRPEDFRQMMDIFRAVYRREGALGAFERITSPPWCSRAWNSPTTPSPNTTRKRPGTWSAAPVRLPGPRV